MQVRSPTVLYVFDLDGTLYDSPGPAPGSRPETWWYDARSLKHVGVPGYDARWSLQTLSEARRAGNDPCALVALLTARPAHTDMRQVIQTMLSYTDIDWGDVILKPPGYAGTTPQYKAEAVLSLIQASPTIRKVVVYEDDAANLAAIEGLCLELGVRFSGKLVSLV